MCRHNVLSVCSRPPICGVVVCSWALTSGDYLLRVLYLPIQARVITTSNDNELLLYLYLFLYLYMYLLPVPYLGWLLASNDRSRGNCTWVLFHGGNDWSGQWWQEIQFLLLVVPLLGLFAPSAPVAKYGPKYEMHSTTTLIPNAHP